jgi:putative FmdB family regulatory protein
MPFYDYACTGKTCGHVHEVRHLMSETPRVKCPKCKKLCKKALTSNVVGKAGKPEIWDYDDIHQTKPKYLKSRDGKTRVRYDPTKHGHRKGRGF